MNALCAYPHLTTDDDGTVRVGKTRYKALLLAGEHFHWGWSAEEILRQHPDLLPGEVYSVLAWFYDHYDELIGSLTEIPGPPQPGQVTRAQLLQRRQVFI